MEDNAEQQSEPDLQEGVEEADPVVERDPTARYARFDIVLGRGAFKTVYRAFDEEEGIEVAWNQVKVSELVTTKEDRDRLFAEIRVLKQLKHKNIMTFYDSWLDTKTCTVNFITELFTSGTLRQYRKRHRHTDDEVLKRWAWQILCGLVYLHGHQPPIIHRDLKCDNIFVNGHEGVVKIGDLGLATLARARTALTVLGTPEFMAPELYDEDYDDRVDVYSFGMCLLELATMEYPYSECKNAAQIYKKVTLGVRPAGLQKVNSPQLAEFINHCISTKEVRPRARLLLKHPYFDTIRSEKNIRNALSAADVTPSVSDFNLNGSVQSVSRTSSDMAAIYRELADLDGIPRAPSSRGDPRSSVASPTAPQRSQGGSPNRRPLLPPATAAPPAQNGPVANEASETAQLDALFPVPSIKTSAAVSEVDAEGAEDRLTGDSSRPVSANSSAGSGSPVERSGINRSASGRQFSVFKLSEDDGSVELRLKIRSQEGVMRVVEFGFDLMTDTAMSIASEMVEDLTLSSEDAQSIAAAIKQILSGRGMQNALSPAASVQAAPSLQDGIACDSHSAVDSDATANTAAWVASTPHHKHLLPSVSVRGPAMTPSGMTPSTRASDEDHLLSPSSEVAVGGEDVGSICFDKSRRLVGALSGALHALRHSASMPNATERGRQRVSFDSPNSSVTFPPQPPARGNAIDIPRLGVLPPSELADTELGTSPPSVALVSAIGELPDTLFISQTLSDSLQALPPSQIEQEHGNGILSSASSVSRENGGTEAASKRAPQALNLVVGAPGSPLQSVGTAPLPPIAHGTPRLNAVAQRLNLEMGSSSLLGDHYLKPSRSAVDLGRSMASPLAAVQESCRNGFSSPSDHMPAGLKKPIRTEVEREAMRRQATASLKNIEFRCLEGLEGVGGAAATGCKTRGTPMAATRTSMAPHQAQF